MRATRTEIRVIIALVLGFILYRVCVEFIEPLVAVVLGLLLAVATWFAIGLLAPRKPEGSDPPQ